MIASVSALTDAVNEGQLTWYSPQQALRESAVTASSGPSAAGLALAATTVCRWKRALGLGGRKDQQTRPDPENADRLGENVMIALNFGHGGRPDGVEERQPTTLVRVYNTTRAGNAEKGQILRGPRHAEGCEPRNRTAAGAAQSGGGVQLGQKAVDVLSPAACLTALWAAAAATMLC